MTSEVTKFSNVVATPHVKKIATYSNGCPSVGHLDPLGVRIGLPGVFRNRRTTPATGGVLREAGHRVVGWAAFGSTRGIIRRRRASRRRSTARRRRPSSRTFRSSGSNGVDRRTRAPDQERRPGGALATLGLGEARACRDNRCAPSSSGVATGSHTSSVSLFTKRVLRLLRPRSRPARPKVARPRSERKAHASSYLLTGSSEPGDASLDLH